MDSERIKILASRIRGAEAAREILEYIGDEKHDPNFVARFLEVLQEELLPNPEKPTGLATDSVERLGATVLEFGVYRGQQFDSIPITYLDWLCRSQEQGLADLRAYLKHPRLNDHRRICVDSY